MAGEMTLDMAKEHATLKIIRIAGKGGMRLRMLQMGLTPGTRIKLLRQAPLADPVEISVRGSKLALRRDEAKNIQVIKAEE